MRDLSDPVDLETRFSGLEVAIGGPGVVPTGGDALPAGAEARAVPAKVGLC